MGFEVDIDRLSLLDERQLLALLVDQTIDMSAPENEDDKQELGRAIFQHWIAMVRDSVCAQLQTFSTRLPPESETIARDAAALIDAMEAIQGRAPVATVAVLILKYGYEAVCPER